MLTGFTVGLGKFVGKPVIHSLQPIYTTATGETSGTQHGTFDNGQIEVKAKPGYAVAGLTVKTGLGLDGMSVTFMRWDGQKLDPADSYTSDWIGGKGGGRETPIGGDGTPVRGVSGRLNQRGVVAGVGLIMAK